MEPEKARRRRGDLAPNPELWEALERGPRLRRIIEDFYRRVYADARLAPFFVHTTMSWVVDHQYAFLGEIFSGEKMYFGDRPRNAHHAMVIDDELFDYREELMAACLRDHGLSKEQIATWRRVEESFRSHIVKAAPFPRKRHGIAVALDGLGTIELAVGGVCDGCASEIAVGTTCAYEQRTGRLHCPPCSDALRAAKPETP